MPEADIDKAFPHNIVSWNLREYKGLRGATLDCMLLTNLTPASSGKEGSGEQITIPPIGKAEISAASPAGTEERTGVQSRTEHLVQVAGAAVINSYAPTRR